MITDSSFVPLVHSCPLLNIRCCQCQSDSAPIHLEFSFRICFERLHGWIIPWPFGRCCRACLFAPWPRVGPSHKCSWRIQGLHVRGRVRVPYPYGLKERLEGLQCPMCCVQSSQTVITDNDTRYNNSVSALFLSSKELFHLPFLRGKMMNLCVIIPPDTWSCPIRDLYFFSCLDNSLPNLSCFRTASFEHPSVLLFWCLNVSLFCTYLVQIQFSSFDTCCGYYRVKQKWTNGILYIKLSAPLYRIWTQQRRN